MNTLDDIILGFLIFFAIDRIIQLLSMGLVEPWIRTKTFRERKILCLKLGSEILMIAFFIYIVWLYRKSLGRLSR